MYLQLSCIQLGDPTVEDHISSQYSSLDFDGISEYTQFFSSTLWLYFTVYGCFTISVYRIPWVYDSYHPTT